MTTDPFDDLPDSIKEAIREMMKRFQEINPKDLENMMNQMFGEDFMEKLRDMQMTDGSFGFSFDPETMKNFESIMRNFMNQSEYNPPPHQEKIMVEEPYYEYSPIVENEGQLIVELPGITDLRQVTWMRSDDLFSLEAENEDAKYFLEIPVKPQIRFKDMFATLRNSVFILPFKRT